jgi:hypothetical protein
LVQQRFTRVVCKSNPRNEVIEPGLNTITMLALPCGVTIDDTAERVVPT